MNVSAILNVVMIQPRGNYANISMNVFSIMNVITMQRRRYCTIIPMNVFGIMNVATMQLGTSCSFDSPGLARNEPTPGQRLQGDSTPYVLSFFQESMAIVMEFMADYA